MLRDRITVLFVGDIIVLVASFVIMSAIRFDWATQSAYLWAQLHIFLFLFAFWLIVFFVFDLYNLRRVNPNPRNIGSLALAVLSASILCVVYFYIFPANGTPKINLAIVAIVSFLLLIAWRRIFYKLYSSRFSQHIGVIGSGPVLEALIEDIKRHPHIGRIIYTSTTYDGTALLPDIDILISHGVDLPLLFSVARQKNCEVLSLSDAYEELFGKVPLALMTEEKATHLLTTRTDASYRLLERLFEMVFASLSLIIVSPFLLLAMLAIVLEDGRSPIYSQKRIGRNGVPFSIYKLQTMIRNAEANGVQWAERNDTRITAVGRILRTTHLDEVPQMINVLKGDLALIGPRPERPELVATLEREIPYYFLRHTIKPGFTGWAQIKFRYARTVLDSQEKFEYDLYYLLKENLLFDLGIFLKTVQIIFTHA